MQGLAKLKVKLKAKEKNGYHNVLTAKKVTDEKEHPAIRDFKGVLKLIAPNNFGFADEVFIDPNTVEEKNLKHEQYIQAKAILTFNKKKNEWGWKAIRIDQTNKDKQFKG